MKKLTVGSLIPGRESPAIMEPEQGKLRVDGSKRKVAQNQAAGTVIKVQQHGKKFDIKLVKDRTLLGSALSENIPIEFKCKKGTCGRCELAVLSGGQLLSGPTAQEQQKLAGRETQGIRLACQATAKT